MYIKYMPSLIHYLVNSSLLKLPIVASNRPGFAVFLEQCTQNNTAALQQFNTMEKIMTLQNIMHPLHTNLGDGVHIISQLINDRWNPNHEHRSRSRGSHHDGHGETTQVPDFDVRESDGYYFLEGEFAGIASKDDLNIEWVGHRTLLIEATVNKVDEEAEWGIRLQSSSKAAEIEGPSAGNPDEPERSESQSKHRSETLMHGRGLRVWMNERHTGSLRKSFTFPYDLDSEHMRARLTNGLVKILVPKLKVEAPEPSRRVHIEE